MIDIALLSCNRCRITMRAIIELHKRTTTPHRLIVLDNGSEDGSPAILEELHRQGLICRLELADENRGVHWGHNRLLEMVESPLYICTDNDLVPQAPVRGEDWIVQLLKLLALNEDYAAIACRPHILIGQGGGLFDDAPAVKEMGHIGAHLRLMRTEVVREVGGWRKDVRPSRNDEEKWICGRLRKAGWKVGYARDVRCIHLFGKSDLGEDGWGYPAGSTHGHRDVWPPVDCFAWYKRDIDWETCK